MPCALTACGLFKNSSVQEINKLLIYNNKVYNNGDVLQEKENVMSYSQIKGCKTKGTKIKLGRKVV